MNSKKYDIGLIWAKGMNIWGQIGVLLSILNTFMIIGIFYTTTVNPTTNIPFWLYILIILSIAIPVILFILKVGISGYYRFFNQQSELHQVGDGIDKIIKHLGIEEQE